MIFFTLPFSRFLARNSYAPPFLPSSRFLILQSTGKHHHENPRTRVLPHPRPPFFLCFTAKSDLYFPRVARLSAPPPRFKCQFREFGPLPLRWCLPFFPRDLISDHAKRYLPAKAPLSRGSDPFFPLSPRSESNERLVVCFATTQSL